MVNLVQVSTLPCVKIIGNKKIILITCRWYNLYSLKIHLYEQKNIIRDFSKMAWYNGNLQKQ